MSRKRLWLPILLMVLALMIAACGGTAPTETTAPTAAPAPAEEEAAPAEEEAAPAESTGANQLEFYSWWTAGGEADGLNAMYDLFKAMYPDIEIVNATVAGGAGSNAKAVLATRMQAGDPPDSFQVHAGHELIDTWVVADKMEPVTFIFEENGWMDAIRPTSSPFSPTMARFGVFRSISTARTSCGTTPPSSKPMA